VAALAAVTQRLRVFSACRYCAQLKNMLFRWQSGYIPYCGQTGKRRIMSKLWSPFKLS